MINLTESLNTKQAQAVTLPEQNALILAGAGSGKTRVLVHRIAYLIAEYGVSPLGIMAVTFTNKAAGEMRSRIESLIESPMGSMWVGTFHGIAHRILRLHYETLGLPATFQVIDSDDQYRLVRRVLKEMKLDEKHFPPKQIQHFINGQKDEGRRADNAKLTYNQQSEIIEIYRSYEHLCRQNALIDFAELLLLAFELWTEHPDVLADYHHRFSHVLVDEFQDTNRIQYLWLKCLVGKRGHIMVVGDDDQSIYGWRGAKIENINLFQTEYDPVTVVRLEQNYRSTKTILAAANHVIANNSERMGKSLWTDGAEGDPIKLYRAFNEIEEANHIVMQIREYVSMGIRLNDMAIFYRSNAQSRILEEALITGQLPYKVYGGMRFFERQEIKNALAYCRLVFLRDDDAAFERIVNTPTRSIGERTVELVRQRARDEQIPLWSAASLLLNEHALSSRAHNALQAFVDLIEQLTRDVAEHELYEQVEHIIEYSGLIGHYQKEGGEKGQSRIENLGELITAARMFVPDVADANDEPMPPMSAFLSHAVLESGEGQAEKYDDAVQLMTLHASKGLEFPVVFITGLEEEIFPSKMCMNDFARLEEERRLFYVGMTRSMRFLNLSYAESRRLYGEIKRHIPSRFIRELPQDALQETRLKSNISKPVTARPSVTSNVAQSRWQIGQLVEHDTFGQGVILHAQGQADKTQLQIQFDNVGVKWLYPTKLHAL